LAPGYALGIAPALFGPFYGGVLSPGTLGNGLYTLSAPGGSQVGAFTVSTVFPSSFTVTNWDSITSIDRSKPLTLVWNGTNYDQVLVVLSTDQFANAVHHITTINCTLPAAPGTYTIPKEALAYLSAVPDTLGTLSVQGASLPSKFNATLGAGKQIDLGTFQGNLGLSKSLAVQ
jgi:hypothetical protein